MGALFSIWRRSVFDGVYTMSTAAPYSRSNIGRISLNAGLKLGGAPTVRGSACPGSQVPTMAASPAIAANTILTIRMSTLNLRKLAGCGDYALLRAHITIHSHCVQDAGVEDSVAVFVATAQPRGALVTFITSFGHKVKIMVRGVHHVDAARI